MISPAWASNWAWSLPLIGINLAVHAFGVVGIAVGVARLGAIVEARALPLPHTVLIAGCLIGGIGCLLTALHGLEAGVWAIAYLLLGAIDTFGNAMFYSVDSMTTRGESGLTLERTWEMMGALEAANGVLLFGISTAFLFVVVEDARKLISRSIASRTRLTAACNADHAHADASLHRSP